jgi:hypothetical protein
MRIPAILLALVAILGLRPAAPKPAMSEAEEVWRMTLPEAIRIGLDNSETVRCRSIIFGATEIPLGEFEPSPTSPPGTNHDESPPPKPPTQADPEPIWKLTLPEAIRIGLANREPVTCIFHHDPGVRGACCSTAVVPAATGSNP